jgi:hypothetical protein
VNVTTAFALPFVALPITTCSGAEPTGTTVTDRLDAAELPLPLVATTVKEYDSPFCRPCTTIGDDDDDVSRNVGIVVIVYDVTPTALVGGWK